MALIAAGGGYRSLQSSKFGQQSAGTSAGPRGFFV